jgi:hypothetical protein
VDLTDLVVAVVAVVDHPKSHNQNYFLFALHPFSSQNPKEIKNTYLTTPPWRNISNPIEQKMLTRRPRTRRCKNMYSGRKADPLFHNPHLTAMPVSSALRRPLSGWW